MRSAPALQVTLRQFDVWRAATALLCAAAAAALACWASLRLGCAAPAGWAAAGAVPAALAAWRASRRAPRQLAWSGEAWRLGPADAPSDDAPAGALHVMLDLGDFLLLRFVAADPRAAGWLPAQRRGHEASWHALRCAVYSLRPPAAASALADHPPPPHDRRR